MQTDVVQPVPAAGGVLGAPLPRMDPKEKFYRHFQESAAVLHDQILLLEELSLAGGERHDATDAILAGISSLSKEVADASDYIPAYDQRTYSEALKALSEKLNTTTTKLAPRRFQFKSRTKDSTPKDDPRRLIGGEQPGDAPASAAAPAVLGKAAQADADHLGQEATDKVGQLPSFGGKNYNEELARPGAGKVRKPSFSTAQEIAISGHNGLHIILPSTASHATSSGSLTNLTGCVVDMSTPTSGSAAFAGLALKDIDRSLIIAGRVAGPVHITGITNSVIVVAARQVRIHECKNVDVYLHCGSHPIIEDCSGMRFAPMPRCYMTAAEEPDKNQWDQVDDFKWLKSEPSPNWSVLPEEDKVVEDVWTKTVPGGPTVSLEGILKAVGVGR